MSLRARLLTGMVALVAAGLAIAAFVTYEEQRSFLLTRVDQQVMAAMGPISAELHLNTAATGGFPAGRNPPGGLCAETIITAKRGHPLARHSTQQTNRRRCTRLPSPSLAA